jgi:exosome complex component RRP40
VIGIVVTKNAEFFSLDINSSTHAQLNTLEFQGATRRDKPKYEEGTLVYCRVLQADKLARTQLTCISALDKKSWNSGEAFFGEIGGSNKFKMDSGPGTGFVKDFPIRFCKELIEAEENQTETTASAYLLNKLRSKLQ